MADLISESNVWPVNNQGAIVLETDSVGGNDVVGFIPSLSVPSNVANNKVKVKLPLETALFDSTGTSFKTDTYGIVSLPARTTPLRVVTSGDSTATVRTPKLPTNQDASSMTVPTWNSGTVDVVMDMDRYAMDQFYPQAYLVGAGGKIGETTTQWLARDTQGASITRYAIDDMLALAPNIAIVRIGINDFGTVANQASVDSAVATAYANIVTGVQRYVSQGVIVFLEGLVTSNPNASNITMSRLAAITLNAMTSAYCEANPTTMRYIDPVGTISDASGAFLPYMSFDGLHYSAYGQTQMGKLEALAATKFFGPSTTTRYQGTNIVANSTFANVSSGIPVGFTTANFNSTVANKKVETINGKPFFTAEYTISSASAQGGMNIPYDPSAMSITSGDKYGFEVDFYLEGLDGYLPSCASGSFFRIDTKNSVGSGNVRLGRAQFNSKSFFPGVWTGKLIFPPIVYGDSSANFLNTSGWFLTFFPAETSGKFKFGISSPRIVKLGQAVLTA